MLQHLFDKMGWQTDRGHCQNTLTCWLIAKKPISNQMPAQDIIRFDFSDIEGRYLKDVNGFLDLYKKQRINKMNLLD